VCAAPFEIWDTTSSRFMTLLNPSEDASAVSRAQGHEEMFDVIREHPLGLGMGIDEPNLVQVIGSRDSMVVTAFVQFGILGATVYLLATIALLVRLWVYYRDAATREGMALGAIAIGLVSMALFGTPTAGSVGNIVWIAAGLGTVPVRARRLARYDVQVGVRSAKVVALRPAVAPGSLE